MSSADEIRAIEAGVFVPNLLTRSGSCRRTSEPSAVADSNSDGSTGLVPTLPISAASRGILIIELDGSQHAAPQEERKDELRTAYLYQQGYRVLRF